MLKKICLLTNYNQYESKRYFTEKLVEAMERQGIKTKVVDAQETTLNAEVIKSIHKFAPDITCSFSSFVDAGQSLWDILRIPHISFLVDPAFYSTSLTNSPYSIISCVDRNDCEVILSNNFKKVFFWPHAVEKELASDKGAKKDYDVVFLGSCYDYESFRDSWRKRFPTPIGKILEDAAELVFNNDTISLAEALVSAWNNSGLDPAEVDFLLLYFYLDNYTRGKDRVELIRSIKSANVHIFGGSAEDNALSIKGWTHYLGSQSNVTIHPPSLFNEGLEILKRSKIVLNSMPFFRNGTHERIFAGLACGCLPVTSESKYLREQFKADEEIVFYQAKHREKMNEQIDYWLAHEKERQHAVEQGRKKVMKHHTWDVRVEELKKIVPELLKK